MSNVFQAYLKGFKLKMIIVEPKTAQLVEPNEELVNLFNSTSPMVQKPYLSSMLKELIKYEFNKKKKHSLGF